jgi:hypothetical protein
MLWAKCSSRLVTVLATLNAPKLSEVHEGPFEDVLLRSKTSAPARRASKAATNPAPPPPITTTSAVNFSVLIASPILDQLNSNGESDPFPSRRNILDIKTPFAEESRPRHYTWAQRTKTPRQSQ